MERPAQVAWAVIAAVLFAASAAARSPAEVRAFRAGHPCPATGKARGACPGHQVDHVRPLCAGGEDRPANMQWLTVADHRFKTLVDERECRKLRRAAQRPAE